MLAAAGVSRLTFVGGEPFLHPLLPRLIREAKAAGLITMVITNGSLLTPQLLQDLQVLATDCGSHHVPPDDSVLWYCT